MKIFLVSIFFLLSFSAISRNNYVTIIDSLKNELLISKLTEFEQAQLLSDIANDYLVLKKYPLSIEYHNQALIKFKESTNYIEQAKENLFIGQTYSAIHNYNKTLEFYLKALNISEKSKNDSLTAIIKHNIGTLYISIGKMENALEYLSKADLFFFNHQPDFKKDLLKNYRFIGVAYGRMNQLDSALSYFNKALNLSNENIDKSQIEMGGLLNNIGAIYHKKKQFENAIKQFSSALVIFKTQNNQRGIGISTFNIALVNKEQKKYEEAIILFKYALENFKKNNDLRSMRECYSNLSNIYDIQDDKRNAFKYFQLFSTLKDSIMNADVLVKVANTEAQYEIEKIEEENAIKIQLIEHQRELSNYRWYFFTGILIIVLLIIIVLLFRHKTKQKLTTIKLDNTRLEKVNLAQEKQYLKEELNFKVNEMANFANYILKRNEILEKLKTEIKLAKKKSDGDIDKISRLVNQSLSFDKDRKEFLIRVERTHESFFFKLKNKFPDLTDNEKRILALVMAELSSKEIASLLNISTGSVDMARYRLRKKMNIESDQSIIDFLANL